MTGINEHKRKDMKYEYYFPLLITHTMLIIRNSLFFSRESIMRSGHGWTWTNQVKNLDGHGRQKPCPRRALDRIHTIYVAS